MTTNPQSEVKRYGDKNCCEECFLPERDGAHLHTEAAGYALPEGCREEDCPCHKESPKSQSIEEREAELKKLYEETNIKVLVEEMEKDVEEYGQYHDDDCPLNREGGSDFGDICECEKIRALKTLAREWMGKVNRMWVANVQNHRKHCSPRGNKELTKIKDKINGSELSRSSTLSTLVKEMEGLVSQLCECAFPDEQMNRCRNCKKVIEDKRTANQGISAAVEVVIRLNK